jgi:hypothetical protein
MAEVSAFRSVDHEQSCSLGVEATVHQISQQRFGDAAVLRVAFSEAQNLLLSLEIDPQSDQHHMVAQVDPVDHDDGKMSISQWRGEPLRHLLRRHGHVATRHGTLRRRTLLCCFGQRLEAPGVLASRNAAGHGVDGVIVEWVPIGSKSEGRKLHLLTVLGPNPRPADGNTAAAQGDLALGRSCSASTPVRISLPQRAAEIFTVLLHHRSQNLAARVEAQIEERVLDVRKSSQDRKRNLHGRRLRQIDHLEVVRIVGMLGHGGGSFVGLVTPSVPHGG